MRVLLSIPMTALIVGMLVASSCRTSDVGLDPHAESEPFDIDVAVELTRLNLYSYQHLTDYLTGEPFELPEGYTLEGELITYEWFSGDTTSVGDDPTPIVMVLGRGDELVVVFRGSVTPSEWLDDVTMAQRRLDEVPGEVWAHEGFVDVYRSVAGELIELLGGLLEAREAPRVLVTGHSLGGSLSTLFAVDLVERTGVQPVVYTLASPRVGDEAFRDAHHERVHTSWRIANINDFVPRYPPSQVSVTRGERYETREYRHVQAVHELEFGEWVEAPSVASSGLLDVDWNPLTAEEIDFSAVDWDAPSLIQNHGICHYYNHLCGQTDDEEGCRARSDGRDGCNAE